MMATVRFREFGLYLWKVVIIERKLNKFSLTELGWDKLAWINHAPVAQLVEHWAVTWEVVSSTPAGSTLRVLK